MDEFDQIARLFRPLTRGAPEALGLMDDAAVIAGRPGHQLVITQDAIVAGVHVLADDPPDLVARKLLRANLSDLAAKGAEPYGYFLTLAWPADWGEAARQAFADGLAQDQQAFGLSLFGGDTVSTPGPFTASATLLGWVPDGTMVRRGGARAAEALMVSGAIGDGGLGLRAARGDLDSLTPQHRDALAARYRLPEPRTGLRDALRRHASAAADVSDGLLADAGHIGEASGIGLIIDLDRMPLSPAAAAWLTQQPDEALARAELAGLGDDYEIVCTCRPAEVEGFLAAAAAAGVPLTRIGETTAAPGVRARHHGRLVPVAVTGWRHR